MSSLTGLFISYCEPYYEPSAEEIEAQRRAMEEQHEREKHTIFQYKFFQSIARIEGESGAIGVKLLRDKQGVLHFMNTKVWPFHYPFCVSNLNEKRTLQEFNEQVYTGKDRSMMFATIVSYPASPFQKYFCLELNPADSMNELDSLNGFFQQVKENFLANEGVTLYFHPTSAVQTEAIKDKSLCLPVITSDKIYGATTYKMIQPGELPYKKIRIFGDITSDKTFSEDELNKWLLQRTEDEIVVIPAVPSDIPVVGGVICGEIIPPLCHVALLCQNRKTPCCFLKNCISKFRAQFKENEVVNGVITKAGCFVKFEGAKADSVIDKSEVPTIEIMPADTSVANLIDIHEDKVHAKDIQVVGAKAAQLANVESHYSQPTFKGTFVIPFHHYNKHVQASAISSIIPVKINRMKHSYFTFDEFNLVQEAIQEEKVDDELVQSVIEKIKQHNMTSVIFRSSTNAEDLTGFNGAGLYESVPLTGDDVHSPQQVAKAIKTVWSSIWSPKAVKERQHFKINHSNVNMAILVQPFIDEHMTDVKVHYNGVCITHDVARHKVKHGFTVSCFPGTKLRATNFYKDQFPELTTLLLGRQANSIDLQITTTATGHPDSLITQEDAEKMVSVFGSLHTSMLNKPHKLNDTVALDIEFMVVDNDKSTNKREIVVLQARPYTVNVASVEQLDEKLRGFMQKAAYMKLSRERFVYHYPLEY